MFGYIKWLCDWFKQLIIPILLLFNKSVYYTSRATS